MGVLNLTPDSFFDGGQYNAMDAALQQCEKMLVEGADFIDLGAYSSRRADRGSDNEKKRLLPSSQIAKNFQMLSLLILFDHRWPVRALKWAL